MTARVPFVPPECLLYRPRAFCTIREPFIPPALPLFLNGPIASRANLSFFVHLDGSAEIEMPLDGHFRMFYEPILTI